MALTPVEEVKVMVGDLGQTSILTDDIYDHFLEKYNNNTNRASIDAAKTILYYLASWPTRERTGDIEVWRNWASSYKDALQMFLKDAATNNFNPIAYAGGISKSDMLANDQNNDTVQAKIYKGFTTGERAYNQNNDTRDDATNFYGYSYDRE